MDWINRIENICEKIKAQIHASNIDDCENLFGSIQKYDKNMSGELKIPEFEQFLKDQQIFITTQELRHIVDRMGSNNGITENNKFNMTNMNSNQTVQYRQLIDLLRESMSEKRKQVVENAFNYIDRSGNGQISIDEMIKEFKADQHPRVRVRDKSAEQVLREFKEAMSNKCKNKLVNFVQFMDYYCDVSATLPNHKEEYFIDLVVKTWGLTSSQSYVSNDRLDKLEGILYEKIRQKTVVKEDEAKTLLKAFKYFDLADTGVVDIKQFEQTLEKFGCIFKQSELQALFQKYDHQNNGKIAYDEFCNVFALIGSGNNPNVNPVFAITRQVPAAIIKKVALLVKKRGQNEDIGLIFSKMDKNLKGVLDRECFVWGLKQLGVVLPKIDIDKLFAYYDKYYQDHVQYAEFVQHLTEQLQAL